MMAFHLALIVLAMTLLHADAGRISRRGGRNYAGGWKDIDESEVPQEVIILAEQTLRDHLTRDKGVRSVEILSARYQTVAGKNYELKILFQVTECPSSASRQDIDDESVCAESYSATCTVKVHHSLTDTVSVREMSCVA